MRYAIPISIRNFFNLVRGSLGAGVAVVWWFGQGGERGDEGEGGESVCVRWLCAWKEEKGEAWVGCSAGRQEVESVWALCLPLKHPGMCLLGA